MNIYQKIFAIIFFISLFGFSSFNVLSEGKNIISDVKEHGFPENRKKLQEFTANVDSILAANLYGDHFWNETYGAVYKALGKNEENNFAYVKAPNGILQYADFRNTNKSTELELALRVKRLMNVANKQDAQVVFLLYPSRYDADVDEGYYGIPYRDMNYFADNFLMYLRRYNVDYIDYRDVFSKQGKSVEDIMCSTDHHWKMEAGFDAMTYLVKYMDEKYDAGFDPSGMYTDINNYVTETYHSNYLGSMGRETGEIYSGLDDYTYISPTFETGFKRMCENTDYAKIEMEGDFNAVIMNKKYLAFEDIYKRELFNTYLGGIYRVERITNTVNKEGPKVMFLRDSYSSPVGAFLSPMCSKLNMYWTQYCSENYLDEKIEDEQPDYIFVAFTPYKLLSEDFTFYVSEDEE